MTRMASCLGCHRLFAGPGSRCPACRYRWQQAYDAARPAHHDVYRTAAWRKLSAEVRDGAVRCHWCAKATTRLLADHIIPVAQRPDLAMDRANLVPSCYGCNTRRGRNLAGMPVQKSGIAPSPAPTAPRVPSRTTPGPVLSDG